MKWTDGARVVAFMAFAFDVRPLWFVLATFVVTYALERLAAGFVAANTARELNAKTSKSPGMPGVRPERQAP